jgi:hypothetical protein
LGLVIGVDLDNTLVDYHLAFAEAARALGFVEPGWTGSKRQLRSYLRQREGGESDWQTLQGQVYGRYMSHARLFDGVYRFLWRCRHRGISVDLVSHKTEFGHGDSQRVPLRTVAIDFLEKRGISVGGAGLLRRIYFDGTREQKVQRIARNKYHWFIDDLHEVLTDNLLPKELGRILFDESGEDHGEGMETCHSWLEIESRLLGIWTDSELIGVADLMTSGPVVSSSWVTRGGNAGLLDVVTQRGERYALKFYTKRNGHDCLSTEFNGLTAIQAVRPNSIPTPFACNRELNAAMYEWIDGEAVTNPTEHHIKQALSFLGHLHDSRTRPEFARFQNASAAFLSGSGFEEQLRARVSLLVRYAQPHSELDSYLHTEMLPVMDEILGWTRSKWTFSPEYSAKLPREMQTLSPSDFGFHNVIEGKNGNLTFIDFEYFGWDDPAKLIADFSFHPGMELELSLKQQWVAGAIGIYGEGILNRLRFVWPMVGLSWCLILLNEYRDDIWQRRCAADPDKVLRHQAILEKQMDRSRALLSQVCRDYATPFFC